MEQLRSHSSYNQTVRAVSLCCHLIGAVILPNRRCVAGARWRPPLQAQTQTTSRAGLDGENVQADDRWMDGRERDPHAVGRMRLKATASYGSWPPGRRTLERAKCGQGCSTLGVQSSLHDILHTTCCCSWRYIHLMLMQQCVLRTIYCMGAGLEQTETGVSFQVWSCEYTPSSLFMST